MGSILGSKGKNVNILIPWKFHDICCPKYYNLFKHLAREGATGAGEGECNRDAEKARFDKEYKLAMAILKDFGVFVQGLF